MATAYIKSRVGKSLQFFPLDKLLTKFTHIEDMHINCVSQAR